MSRLVKGRWDALLVVAIATACILAYSLWGSWILHAQREAAAAGSPAQQLARN